MFTDIPTKVKNAITTPRFDIVFGVALVTATAAITALVTTNDKKRDEGLLLTTADFTRMRETGDTLRIRDHELGDFRVYAID